MALGTARTKLGGPQLVQAFLKELDGYLMGVPYGQLDGTPEEIVQQVIRTTDRFTNCSSEAIDNLKRQIVLAIRTQGQQLKLKCEQLGRGRVRVSHI